MTTSGNSLQRWVPTSMRGSPKGFWASALAALALEFGLVGIAIGWVTTHSPEELPQVVPLVMAMMDAPKEVIPKQPEPPKLPVVVPQTKAIAPVAQAVTERRPVEEPAPPMVAKPTAFSVPPVAVQSMPVVPDNPAPPLVDPAIAYNLKLAAAVQAAFVVPGPATSLGFKGRTRLEFQLKDGVVSNVKILQASGLGAVDRAALKAVEVAVFPAPPPTLLGKEGIYQIWVACY